MSLYSDRMNENKKYEFSFEPKSLWYYEKNKILEDLCDTGYGKETAVDRIKAGRDTFMSGWNKEFHKRLVEFYTIENETILDPFAGHSSSFIPYLLKRNFIGFEVTRERFEIQQNHINKLKSQYNFSNNINLINNSSEYLKQYINEKVDCVITDPPFWTVEKYENPVNGEQLSHINDYNKFLDSLSNILLDCVDVLRPNGFMIVKLADLRKDGKFYDLTGDITNILKTKIQLTDKIILELNPSKRHPLYLQAITNKNMLKVQEFCLVFRKITNKNDIDIDNDRINHNRALVKSIYKNENELFYSLNRGKVDYITNQFKTSSDNILTDIFGE